MAHDLIGKSPRGRRAYITPLILALIWIALVLSLGYIGLRDVTPRFSDRIYHALQLFAMDGSHFPEHMGWELQVARFLAPAGEFLALVLGILGIALLFVNQVHLVTLGISRRNHVVVCGLGRKGLQLVTDFRRRGFPVLVIDKDVRNPLISACDQLGAMLLIGDATKPAILRKARIGRAECVIATCGDDGANVEIALCANELLSAKSPSRAGNGLNCYVHIVNLELRTLLGQQRALTARSDRIQVTIFNVYENSARLLFRDQFLDYQKPILSEADPRQAHLVVFGFGQQGESVVLQAVKMAHFPNGKKLRVTVIDKEATRRRNRFLTRFPSFDNLCEAVFIESDAENPAVLSQLEKWCLDQNSIVSLAVCFNNDSHSLSFGLTLRSRIGPSPCPILVRMKSHAGLAKLVADVKESSERLAEIHGFAKVEEASTVAVVVNDGLNTLARKIHAEFVSKRAKEGRSVDDPSMKRWEDLDSDLKDSNWQQTEHLWLKLRAINCRAIRIRSNQNAGESSGTVINDLSDCDAAMLARMEHSRWVTERSLAGWKRGEVKDVEKRTHPDLKPWEELEESVRKYDLEAVKLIPKLVQLDGKMICRNPGFER